MPNPRRVSASLLVLAIACSAQGAPTQESAMKPVTVINRLAVKPGKMDELVATQHRFAAEMMKTPTGLVGGRLYRSLDGTSVVLVSTFASVHAKDEVFQLDAFKQHLKTLQTMVESSSPNLYEEAYTTGDFR
jgi:quinol monooxygenase YgiN